MIIAECENDQALMYRLGVSSDQIRHEFGRSRVLSVVDRWEKPIPIIGVIDEDPNAGRHPKINNYRLIKGSAKTVSLMRKDDLNKWIIVIPSFLEDWLCKVAKRNKVEPNSFSLPDDPVEMHKISFKRNENAIKFLIELVKTRDDELLEFKEWLNLAVLFHLQKT